MLGDRINDGLPPRSDVLGILVGLGVGNLGGIGLGIGDGPGLGRSFGVSVSGHSTKVDDIEVDVPLFFRLDKVAFFRNRGLLVTLWESKRNSKSGSLILSWSVS